MAYIPRTDRLAHKSHIHSLVKDKVGLDGVKYLYRCTTCGTRLQRKSGVMVSPKEAK